MENTVPTQPPTGGALIHRISTDEISRLILRVRGEYVLLTQQLARIYGIEPRSLNQTVKRNPNYFPENSFFQLSREEFRDVYFEADTVSWSRVNRARPYAFTLDAIIPLQQLLKKHGSDDLNFDMVRAFVNKQKRLESLIG